MQALRFDAAVDNILSRDKRFEQSAYFMLKDALDFTLKRAREDNDGEERHVSGEELLYGFRDYAVQEFGPMAHTLLREWGVHSCPDVGDMVFHLIEEGMFGKQDSDTLEDFRDYYNFDEALLKPFIPECMEVADVMPKDEEPSQPSPAPQDAS